ncbi:MAG: hypothetical protein ACKOUS_09345 [Alphaproteobacteria bacterium]
MAGKDERQVVGPHAQAAAEERRARAAQALRDNLRRRKAQARARDDGEPREDASGADPLSGGRAGG